jgi:hypothetical protein
MAHNVKVKKVAVLAKDGHVLKGKYRYVVTCKHRACRAHPIGEATSESRAALMKQEHHFGVSFLHTVNHPNDKAHPRTEKRKAEKLVKSRG